MHSKFYAIILSTCLQSFGMWSFFVIFYERIVFLYSEKDILHTCEKFYKKTAFLTLMERKPWLSISTHVRTYYSQGTKFIHNELGNYNLTVRIVTTKVIQTILIGIYTGTAYQKKFSIKWWQDLRTTQTWAN